MHHRSAWIAFLKFAENVLDLLIQVPCLLNGSGQIKNHSASNHSFLIVILDLHIDDMHWVVMSLAS